MASPVEPVATSDVGTVTIAVDASLSTAAFLQQRRLSAIIIPADTEGSVLTFQASIDGINYFDVYNGAGEYQIAFTDPCILIVPAVDFLAFPYLKVRTGTAGSPTNQSGAAATLTLVAV